LIYLDKAYFLSKEKKKNRKENISIIFTTSLQFIRSVNGTINLWNLKTKRIELTLDGHDGKGILAADFQPCGRVIRYAIS